MDQRKTDVRQVAGFGTSGDDAARFLRELRQLRDGAGLGQAELAARAHFPFDSIKAAEVGPALPELPVLAAYVKGCGGTTEEWEERWRSLTRSPSLPLQTTRSAGNSPAATAGARIGSAAQDAETPDPAVIIAALNRVADDMASGGDPLPARDDTPSWPVLPAEQSPVAVDAGEDEPRGAGQPAGWDPIRVSTAWPVLPPSARRTDLAGDARRPTAASGGSLPRESASRESAPWESAPWETAPWAEEPASTWAEHPVGGEADLGATTQQAGTGTAGASPNGAGTLSGTDGAGTPGPGKSGVGAPRATSQVTAAAAAGAAQGPARIPARAGVRAGSAAGQPAGSSRTRVLVVSAVLLCVIAVLLAVFI